MKPLNRTTAPKKPDLPVKVLQFGEGNFLRGFVDWMIDIMNEKTAFNGAVQIIQPIKQGIVHLLNEQDGLYHVLLNGISGGAEIQEKRMITCVKGGINPYSDYQAYLRQGENPELKFIISNTTEAGISFDEKDQDMKNLPDSFPGKLTALLYHRFRHFNGEADKGLIIIPCELIEKNGTTLRQIVLQYIQLWSLPEAFARWTEEHNMFCNTLVDRIVPGYPKDSITEIQQELSYEDKLVVKAEPFHLWVIEGPARLKEIFPAEEAGLKVKFVDDQTPYRTRKVRILNGAHTALVPVAYLQGLRTVREAVEDAGSGKFIEDTIFEEIIPTMDLPKEELEQFASDVLERFRNPFIHHELLSISLNSVSKYKVRVLPTVLEYEKRFGKVPERLLHSLAALILFYRGVWNGESIPLNDGEEVLETFRKAWKTDDPAQVSHAVLSNQKLWDKDLTQIPGLQDIVIRQMEILMEKSTVSEKSSQP